MSISYFYSLGSGSVTSASTSSDNGNIINTNTLLDVTSGSTVTSAVLEVSAVTLTGSGTAVSNPGGSQWVFNGGSITADGETQALTGGAALVTSGGTLVSASVDAGAGVVNLGGLTSGIVLSGGFEEVFSGGIASGTVNSGGTQYVYSGGLTSATSLQVAGAQVVSAGGVADGTTVAGYGTQDVYSGGTANDTIVAGGGTETVHAGGSSWQTVVTAGIEQVNGFDLSATIDNSGVQDVLSGGSAQSTFLISGGVQVVSAGGVTLGVNDQTLGTQTISAGGIAKTTYLTGGVLNILSGGIAETPIVSSGEITVQTGGVVSGAVNYGGTIEVMNGGVASGSILSGGQQILLGGSATGTQILSGGSEVVVSGTASNVTVAGGGSETVYSGGTVSNVHIVGAGVLSLESGAIVSGAVNFSGSGGKLELIGTTLASVTIDGLAVGDSIDLANLTGNSASYGSGTLSVYETPASSGSVTTPIVQLVASLALGMAPDGTLTVTSDGHGGTLITVTAFTVASALTYNQMGDLPGGAQIADSAANVSANIDALQTLAAAGKLVGVTLTDSGIPTVSVSAAQLTSDASAINDISGTFTLGVSAAANNVTIAGLSAHATVVEFSGSSSQYTIAAVGDGSHLTVTSTGSVDHISNVTALQFSDVTEIVATATHASGTVLSSLSVAELYSAALTRAPDVTGLNYYENVITANPTLSGVTLAEYFLSSPEYTGAHSYAQTSAGDTQFVNDLYTNVLHRSGSTSEVSFYTTLINQYTSGLTAGTAAYTAAELQAHAQVLEYFSASAEFLSDIQITAAHPASASHWLQLI